MTKEQQEKFEEIQSIINQLVYDLEELKTNLGSNNGQQRITNSGGYHDRGICTNPLFINLKLNQ